MKKNILLWLLVLIAIGSVAAYSNSLILWGAFGFALGVATCLIVQEYVHARLVGWWISEEEYFGDRLDNKTLRYVFWREYGLSPHLAAAEWQRQVHECLNLWSNEVGDAAGNGNSNHFDGRH
jgi:hypothetical protein